MLVCGAFLEKIFIYVLCVVSGNVVEQSIFRDRVNAEIVHFYAEKIQKMHFQNFNASWDAGRLFVLDHFILNKTKRSEVEISRPQSEVEISWPPYWNEQRRRLGTILKHPGVLHAYPPF